MKLKKTIRNGRQIYSVYRNRKLVAPMLMDVIKGKFRLSLFTWAALVFTLLYLIVPFDLVPDFIPFLGWMDDGAFLYLLLRRLGHEAQQYRLYRSAP